MTFVSLKRLVGRHRQAFEVIKSSPHTLNGLVTTETGACTAESYVDFIDRFLTDSPLRRRFNRRTEQRAFQFDHMPLLLEQDGASIHKRATLIPVLGKHKVRTVEMFPLHIIVVPSGGAHCLEGGDRGEQDGLPNFIHEDWLVALQPRGNA